MTRTTERQVRSACSAYGEAYAQKQTADRGTSVELAKAGVGLLVHDLRPLARHGNGRNFSGEPRCN